MKANKKIIQLMVVLSLALPYVVYAAGGAGSSHGRGATRGDISHDHGEMNFDRRFKQIDDEMDDGRSYGTPVDQLRAGTPRPSDKAFSDYNYYNEMMRDHR